jgi:hypothetical protein
MLEVIAEPVLPSRTAVNSFVARVRINLLFGLTPPGILVQIRNFFQESKEIGLQLHREVGGKRRSETQISTIKT